MLTVLYGKVGTGKSTHILEMIKKDCENKRQSYLIVPEQKTVISEREIASQLSPTAQLYTEAINFTRLANKLFRIYGGLKYNYVTKNGKSLIMYKTICEVRESLKEYRISKGKEKTAVKMFLDAVGELKTYSVSSEELFEAMERTENPRLKGRLQDLITVKGVYERILYERFSDPYDDILMLTKKLKEHNFFKGANVYIDSFYGFTGSQLNVLYEIAKQCDNLVIALDMPLNAQPLQYAKIGQTSEKIEQMARRLGIKMNKVGFDTDRQHTNPAIEYICDKIWDFSALGVDNYENIELVLPEDEFDECDYVASGICKLIRKGYRYSDIAVVMRNGEAYRGTVDFALDKYKIPYFYADKSNILSKPLIHMIFSVLEAVNSYRIQDIGAFIKSGYADIDEEAGAELEEYMYRWNIQGRRKVEGEEYWSANPDGYVDSPTVYQMEALARIHDARDALLKDISPLRHAFDKRLNCKEVLTALYNFLESLKIREKLDKEIKSADKDEAMEIAQLYTKLISALDTVADIMGNDILDPEELSMVLRYSLDGMSIGSIPTGEDKVTVGEASGIRAKNIRHVFVLGATAGSFPADVSDDGFFSDLDKTELESYGIVLSSLNDVRADDELLNFKNALALASSGITVLSPKNSIRGGKKEPSLGFSRIKALLKGIKIIETDKLPLYEKIFSRDIAKEYLSFESSPTIEAISNILGEKRSAIGFSNENEMLDKDDAERIFTNYLSLSQSRIETYVKCHFKYYCDYLLGLKSSKRYQFGSDLIGTLTHAVFEKFLLRVKNGNLSLDSLTDDETEAMVDEIIDEHIIALFGGRASKKIAHLIDRLRSNLYIFVKELASELAQSRFTPEYFELPMGRKNDDVPPLLFKVGKNAKLSLHGVCDRVDVFKKDGKTYVRVVDYKSGSKKLSDIDIGEGLGLQMLIYLFSLCKMGDCDFKNQLSGGGEILPGGVMYFPLQLDKTRLDKETDLDSDEAIATEKDAISSGIKRVGIYLDDVEIIRAQDSELKGRFLPKRDGRTKGSYMSYEGFEETYRSLEATLDDIGTSMLSGEAMANAKEINGRSLCDYCNNRAVCRRRK